jgi:RNA polymerase sigma-70 factor (ECF subfamily)
MARRSTRMRVDGRGSVGAGSLGWMPRNPEEGIASRLRQSSSVVAALLHGTSIWPGILRSVDIPKAGAEVDELVLARARHGDHDAFTSIVGHYDHRLRALAFRLLGDRDRMDDVLQEAYVKAFRALPRFKGSSALGTWLYRITYNACLDDLRRRPAVAPVDLDDERARFAADPSAGPADVAVARGDLAAALDRLPPDQRTAVLLVDAYGMDYGAAAEVLGVRAGTIGSRLSRARAVLRAALEESG